VIPSLLRVSLQKKNFKLAVDRNKYKRRIKEIFRTNNLYKRHGCFVFLGLQAFY
jgi:ribonuclease P protein component